MGLAAVEGNGQRELFRALAVLAEPPGPEAGRLAEILGLGSRPPPEEYTELFLFQLYPYASVYVGAEGRLGGDARDRIAGFWRAVGLTPPAEPDHLAVLLGLYATVAEREHDEPDGTRRPRWRGVRHALLWEHLLSWLGPYLARVEDLGSPVYAAWAASLRGALAEEAAALGGPVALPLHLREAPPLPTAEAGADEWLQGVEVALDALLHDEIAVRVAQHPAGEREVERTPLVRDEIVAHEDHAGAAAAQRPHRRREGGAEERDPPLEHHQSRRERLEVAGHAPPAPWVDRIEQRRDREARRLGGRVVLALAREQEARVLAREGDAPHLGTGRQGLAEHPQVLRDAAAPGRDWPDEGDAHQRDFGAPARPPAEPEPGSAEALRGILPADAGAPAAFVTPERWWLLIPFYLTFGIGHSGWLVLFQTLPADFFGTPEFATIRGLSNALQVPVSIVIPLLMGYVFDTRGNYELAYLAVAGFVAFGALCLALVRRPMWNEHRARPQDDRKGHSPRYQGMKALRTTLVTKQFIENFGEALKSVVEPAGTSVAFMTLPEEQGARLSQADCDRIDCAFLDRDMRFNQQLNAAFENAVAQSASIKWIHI